MELRQLRYFIRVAETLHFGRAAEREYVAQSVISTQISALERELGFRLFDRTSHRVALTPAGEAFLLRAQRMLADIGAAVEEARSIASPQRARLRVGTFGEGAGPLTHLILSAFRAVNPSIDIHYVELSMVNQLDAVVNGDVDVALLRLPIADSRVEVDPLFSEPRVAVVPVDHELADAPSVSVEDLLDQPFAVAADGSPAGWRSYWTFDEQRGEQSRVAAEVRSIPESLATIAYRGAVDTFPVTASVVFQHPGVRFVPLRDAEPTSLAVVSLRNRDDQAVDSFRKTAEFITDHHLDQVPGATRLRSVP
jgi:DNA-binding transcriptional LysR family regulator